MTDEASAAQTRRCMRVQRSASPMTVMAAATTTTRRLLPRLCSRGHCSSSSSALRRHHAHDGSATTTTTTVWPAHARGAAVARALCVSRRRYVNVLWRMPPKQTIPRHSPTTGERVDVELFVRQIKDMLDVLRMTRLVEAVHEMRSCPYWECVYTSELLFQHYELILPMPRHGREQRAVELGETLRYIRGCGATAGLSHVLQDVKGGRASGNDLLAVNGHVLIGYGTSRTNKLCAMALTSDTLANDGDGDGSSTTASSSSSSRPLSAAGFEAIELQPDCPPLAEAVTFAGVRTLLVQDTPAARHAATAITSRIARVPWQVVYIERDCSVLSHLCGAEWVYDVLCDEDYPATLERIGLAGLNPFPVAWSEPRKLGVTMQRVCLVARFAPGSMSGGGIVDNTAHAASSFNYHGRDIARQSQLFVGGQRVHGDSFASFEAQRRGGELFTPVHQSPPRYAPPMHGQRRGVPSIGSGARTDGRAALPPPPPSSRPPDTP